MVGRALHPNRGLLVDEGDEQWARQISETMAQSGIRQQVTSPLVGRIAPRSIENTVASA